MNSTFTRATVRGVFWTYLSFYLGKLLVLVSTVILARLLTKSDFGVVSFALLLIGFLEMINNAGISSALIYYQDDERAVSTAFWLDLGVGILMFAGTWLVAPLAASYFDDPRVVELVRIFAFLFLISSLEDVPKALLTRELSFGVKFIPDTLQAVTKGFIAILGAVMGLGVWSLVIAHICGALVSMITFWRIVPWRPRFEVSNEWIRSIFSYGGGIVATNILSYILVNIDYLFVGFFLGATALGVYTIAFRIPDLLIVQFCSLVGKVIFPVYAKMKNNPDTLNKAFLMTMSYVSIITIPIGLGLMLIAEPLILTLFTDKWSDAIPVVRAIALYALFLSLAYNATHVYKARAEISLMTKISALRATILIPALWWASSQLGTIEAVGWTHALVAFIGGAFNLVVAARIMNTSLRSVIATLRPAIIAGGLMSVMVLGALYLSSSFSSWLQLVVGITTGLVSYVTILSIIQKGIFRETWKIFRSSMSAGSQFAE